LKRLRDQVNKSTAMKDVIEKFAGVGVEPVVADSDDFIRAAQRGIRNFTRVAKEANIKAD